MEKKKNANHFRDARQEFGARQGAVARLLSDGVRDPVPVARDFAHVAKARGDDGVVRRTTVDTAKNPRGGGARVHNRGGRSGDGE